VRPLMSGQILSPPFNAIEESYDLYKNGFEDSMFNDMNWFIEPDI